MTRQISHDCAILAARSPKPAGRQRSGRATRRPYAIRHSAALTQPPGTMALAGDTEALFCKGFSRPRTTTVLQTACLLGGSAVGRKTCVNHNRKQSYGTRRESGAASKSVRSRWRDEYVWELL